ncbi:MAG: hypothetical protein SX243_22540 [Acidobacteriota bacterium]|nr:hypothetical protein [Acidobacteriota bacterium]
MLCSADNAENLCRLSEATYLSILNTLTAFVEGKRSDSEGWGIRTLLPLQYANAGPKMLDPLDIVTLPFRVRPLNLRRSGSETRPNRAYEISHYHPYVDPEARKLSSSDLCRELTQASEQGEDFHETDTRHFYYLGIGESTRPAVTGFSLSLYTLGAGLRDDSDGAAALVGASFAFSLRKDLWGGLHPLSANYRLGIGQGDWGGSRSTLFDLSVGFPLAFTHEGLLTHEIVVGVIGAARKGSFEPSPHLSYRLGAEVERFILFVQVGRAWQGEGDLAVSAGLSLGFGARGGGPIRLIDRRQKRR